MGKAGTWIRNLILGRRTENHKKIKDTPFSEEQHSATPAIFSGTGRGECRQRWSFRRLSLSRTENAAHNGTRSFHSIVSTGQMAENVLFMEYQKDDLDKNSTTTSSSMSPTAAAQVRKMYTISVKIPGPQCGQAQTAVAAATRIQATYRSYLAKRALRALRGLVKLQALVRGHLVRKRTNATLKSLHALISIQVRARIQRTKAVDQDINVYHNEERGLGTNNIQQRKGFFIKTDHSNINRSQKKYNNNYKRGHHNDDNQQFSRREAEFFSSEKISRELQVPAVSCSRMHDSQININIVESHNRSSGQQYHDDLPFVIPEMLPAAKSAGSILYHDDYPIRLPSFMCNTESSKAKVRSHSEPKQRPKRSITEKTYFNRRSMSNNRMEAVLVQDFQPRLHHVSFPCKTSYPKEE